MIEATRDLLRDLWSERRRIAFVTAGVVWGTVSLTFLMSFGIGFDSAMNKSLEASGDRTLVVRGRSTGKPFGGLEAGRPIRLTAEDAASIAAQVPAVEHVSTEYRRTGIPLTAPSGRTLNGGVHGVDPGYEIARDCFPAPGGRFLNPRDVSERRRVAFVGWQMAERLFQTQNAVGRTFRLRGVPFTVVGVMKSKIVLGNYAGQDRDKVFIPSTTYRTVFGQRFLQYVPLQLADGADETRVTAEIFRVLGRRKRFDPADRAALGIRSGPRSTAVTRDLMDGTRLFLLALGVLSLLVAVIGVGNATYVMVEERSREIGIQMAVGARPRTIAFRQLAEGLAIVFMGGVLGLALSAILLAGLNAVPLGDNVRGYLGHPTVSWTVAFTVLGILGTTGWLAGWFPARRAAAIDPVHALSDPPS